MSKKIIPLISVIIIFILAIMFLYDYNSVNKKLLEETFHVDAIFYEDQEFVEITFQDYSQKTNSVLLEILGLSNSFQKIFNDSNFKERIQFTNSPKYGWKIHPVVLVVDHEEFGKIEIKTEIHIDSEPPKPIIFSTR